MKTNDQMSIEEINAGSIADVVVKAVPATRSLLEPFFQRRLPDSVDNDSGPGDGYQP
ncbi:hypothetical protein [Mesorhizobium sp. LSHC414A00]|uniref:hypothetical protein n=1 Tax=Mesorhizobium sp. LSHC414A00 TaxID=1287287 RepID=UPI000415FC12|nr:hypothetical protein [Mesorhizobium sp. LSHC414A00]